MLLCLEREVEKAKYSVLAWALMDNHLHLLVRCSGYRMSKMMQTFEMRFARYYNSRTSRRGHVFMGKFKSILVQTGSYLLELVRYIHLNPVRAGLVAGLSELGLSRYTGHAAVMGSIEAGWQDIEGMLDLFGGSRKAYLTFLADGLEIKRRVDYEDGVWLAGRHGIAPVAGELGETRRYQYTGSILGSREFAADVARRMHEGGALASRMREHHDLADSMTEAVCECFKISSGRLCRSADKSKRAVAARSVLARLLFDRLFFTQADIARYLGLSPAAVSRLLTKKMAENAISCYKRVCQQEVDKVSSEEGSEEGSESQGRGGSSIQ